MSEPQRDPRPREVWVVSILLMIFGLLGALVGVFLLGSLSDDASHGVTVSPAAYAISVVTLAVAIAQLTSGIFVLTGQEWARKLAIGLCGLNAVAGLVSLFSGAVLQAIIGIAINIAIIRLLSKYEVSSWCR